MNASLTDFAPYHSRSHQIEMWTKFFRGRKVMWSPDAAAARLLYGIVENESTARPGFYYVRSEEGVLHLVSWAILETA